MIYIVINKGQDSQFRKRINYWNASDPVETKEPDDKFVLPETILDIEGAIELMPQLESLPRIDEGDIKWIEEDNEI